MTSFRLAGIKFYVSMCKIVQISEIMSKEERVMQTKSNNYKGWLLIGIAALLGWIVGYYVRWDRNTNRPYITHHQMRDSAQRTPSATIGFDK